MKFLLTLPALAAAAQTLHRDALTAMGVCIQTCPERVAKCKATGLPLNPGSQIETGFCMTTPLGALPNGRKKPFSFIVGPEDGEEMPVKSAFAVHVKVGNFDLEPALSSKKEYMMEPQMLNKNGFVMGHSHIAIQFLGPLDAPIGGVPPQVPAADNVEFFAPFTEDRAHGVQDIVYSIEPGLTKLGWYRICTMLGNRSHGPIYTIDRVDHADGHLNVFHDVQSWPGDCVRIKVLKEDDLGLDLPVDPHKRLTQEPVIPVHVPAHPIKGFWRG